MNATPATTTTPATEARRRRRELLHAAYPVLLAIASGSLPASSEMWDCAVDRVELAGVAIDARRSQAGALRLVAYLEGFEQRSIQ